MKTVAVEYLVPEGEAQKAAAPGTASLMPFIFEVLVCAVGYQVIFQRLLVSTIEKRLINSSRGQTSAVIGDGTFLRSKLEEVAYSLSLAAHHILSGSLMLTGYLNGNSNVWLHGIALEMGYEVVDTLALLANSFPYSKLKYPALKVIPFLHHVPTLLIVPILIRLGYHHNPDIQALGWSLILAGGLGFLAEGLKKLLNREYEMGKWLMIHLVNAASLIGFRFLAFPVAANRALQTLRNDPKVNRLYEICLAGFVSLMVFNVSILGIYMWKLVNFSRKWATAKVYQAASMPQKLYDYPSKQS